MAIVRRTAPVAPFVDGHILIRFGSLAPEILIGCLDGGWDCFENRDYVIEFMIVEIWSSSYSPDKSETQCETCWAPGTGTAWPSSTADTFHSGPSVGQSHRNRHPVVCDCWRPLSVPLWSLLSSVSSAVCDGCQWWLRTDGRTEEINVCVSVDRLQPTGKLKEWVSSRFFFCEHSVNVLSASLINTLWWHCVPCGFSVCDNWDWEVNVHIWRPLNPFTDKIRAYLIQWEQTQNTSFWNWWRSAMHKAQQYVYLIAEYEIYHYYIFVEMPIRCRKWSSRTGNVRQLLAKGINITLSSIIYHLSIDFLTPNEIATNTSHRLHESHNIAIQNIQSLRAHSNIYIHPHTMRTTQTKPIEYTLE